MVEVISSLLDSYFDFFFCSNVVVDFKVCIFNCMVWLV